MFDFAANVTVKDLAEVPAQFHPLYEDDDAGGFRLSTDPKVVAAVAAITGQSKALNASRAEAKELNGKVVDLAPLSEWGVDPTSIATAFSTKIEDMQTEIAKGKGATLDLDNLRESMNESHAKELVAKDSVISQRDAQLHDELVINRSTAAIIAAKGNVKLLTPHMNNFIKTVPDATGKLEAHVVDEAGARRFSGHTGKHMTIEELVVEMKGQEEFGVCFESEAKAGGGAKPPGAAPANLQSKDMSSQDKIADGLAKRAQGR